MPGPYISGRNLGILLLVFWALNRWPQQISDLALLSLQRCLGKFVYAFTTIDKHNLLL